jgi:hypothetical protein
MHRVVAGKPDLLIRRLEVVKDCAMRTYPLRGFVGMDT